MDENMNQGMNTDTPVTPEAPAQESTGGFSIAGGDAPATDAGGFSIAGGDAPATDAGGFSLADGDAPATDAGGFSLAGGDAPTTDAGGFKLAQPEAPAAAPVNSMVAGDPAAQQANPYGTQPQQPYGAQPQNPYGGQQPQNPYGAYNAATNPYNAQGQPQGGQIPYMGPGEVGGRGPVTPPKKKKTGKIIGITAACLAAVALIVCGIIFLPRIFGNPKKKLEAAFEESLKFEGMKSYLDEQVDLSSIGDKFLKEGGTVSTSFQLDEVMGADSLSDFSVETSLTKDNAKKQVYGDCKASYKGKSLLSTELYATEDKTYVSVPELLNGYFSIPNKDIINAILKSPLNTEDMSAYAGMIPQINIDYFAEKSPTQDIDFDDIELWQKAKVKNEGNKKVSVAGNEIKAKKYEVTIAEEDLETILVDTVNKSLDSLVNNPALAEYLERSGLTSESLDQYRNQISGIVRGLISDDFVFYMYVKDDKIVKFDCTGEMSLYGVKMGYTVYVDSYDGHATGLIEISAAGKNIGLKYDIDNSGNDLIGNAKIYGAGEDITLDISIKRNGQSEHAEVKLDMAGKDAILSWDGELTDVNKGTAFTYNFKNLKMTFDDEDLFSMSGSFSMDTSKRETKALDTGKKEYSLTEMTADELQEAFADNNVETWVMNLLKDFPELKDIFMNGALDALGSGSFSTPSDEPIIIDEEEDGELDFDTTTED